MADDLVGIGKAISRVVDSGEKFLERLIGPWLDEQGQRLADGVREKRRRNLQSIAAEAEQMATGDLLRVPGRILFPILESAAQEEDPEMQRRWASLLAHAATDDDVLPAYAEILRQLTPLEAKILNLIYSQTRVLSKKSSPIKVHIFITAHRANILSEFPKAGDRWNLIATDLQRLGLIEGGNLQYGDAKRGGVVGSTYTQIQLTGLGQAFVVAVNPPGADLGGVYITVESEARKNRTRGPIGRWSSAVTPKKRKP